MKKKLLLLLFVVLTFSLTLTACGSDEDFDDPDLEEEYDEEEYDEEEEVESVEGTSWMVTEMYDGEGNQVPPEDVELTFGEIIYEFNEGGELLLKTGGQSEGTEAAPSSWTQDGDRIDVDSDGVPSVYIVDRDTMITENEDVKMVLERQ